MKTAVKREWFGLIAQNGRFYSFLSLNFYLRPLKFNASLNYKFAMKRKNNTADGYPEFDQLHLPTIENEINAWWSKEQKCWVNEKFHILENVTLFERDKARRGGSSRRRAKPALSSFTWNKVIFKSFEAGNLKSIDFEFLKSLQSAVAKRLYRFLDKRFFHKKRYEFDLKQLCWEHIGLSRNYDAANLKRALRPAIRELEKRGFLTALPTQERFYKIRTRDWCVVFEKARPTRRAAERKERTREVRRAPSQKQRAERQAREVAAKKFWESLSDTERRGVESEALAQANPIEMGVINRGGVLAAVTKREVLDAYALRLLKKRSR